MQLKNTIIFNLEPHALRTKIRKYELIFAMIDSINGLLQYCKSPLGNNRKIAQT